MLASKRGISVKSRCFTAVGSSSV